MKDLRVRAKVMLSNLVVASKTHARNFAAFIRKTSRMERVRCGFEHVVVVGIVSISGNSGSRPVISSEKGE